MRLLTRLLLWLAEREEDRVSDEYLRHLLRTHEAKPDQVVIVRKQLSPGRGSTYTREAS